MMIFHLNGVALCFSGKESPGCGEGNSLRPHKVPLMHTKDCQASPLDNPLFETHLELLGVKFVSSEKTLLQSLEEHLPSDAKGYFSLSSILI